VSTHGPLPPGDFRSDTVTRPTDAMRAAMASAEVGDDVFGDDPTVAALQTEMAARLGHEAGLFVPSGTMANQIALLVHCRPGDDVIVGWQAHSFAYEGGGGAALAGVQFSVLGTTGHFDAPTLAAAIQGLDPSGHAPPTRLVMVENTHNRGGGVVLPVAAFQAVVEAAHAREVPVHLDGARLFNAAAAAGCAASDWASRADSVSVCLSKGLGAPVGSVLCGSRAFVTRAHRYRKMLGGGMRQAGVLAAAGRYALTHHLERLVLDHQRARALAVGLAGLPGLRVDLERVQTNIVFVALEDSARFATAAELLSAVSADVRAVVSGPRLLRLVTHLDVDDAHVARAIEAFGRALR
jgi:threonine aldolase